MLFLLLPATPLHAQDQNYAPFGLSWGTSVKQIEAAGVTLELVEENFYQTASLPANADWAETYILYIDKKQGLVRVAAYTGNILNDPSGQMGKRMYFRLRGELEHVFVRIGSQENDAATPGIAVPPEMSFYTCLDSGPCGSWFSNFVSGDVNAQLILETLDAEAGYISIIYENNALVRKMKK